LLKTINDSNHDWYVRIPHALWAYRTSIQTPIGVTPFSFVYGARCEQSEGAGVVFIRFPYHTPLSSIFLT